jgi:hypothetical protein
MTDSEIDLICNFIRQNVEVVPLSTEYFYSHLSLCIIDAVYSLGAKYSSTTLVPIRYCDHRKIQRLRNPQSDNYPAIENQESISQFIEFFKENDIEIITGEIFKNRQMTSSHNGILKALAVYQFAQVLQKFNINYFQDISKVLSNDDFENAIFQITGQSYGTSLTYFFMLCGNKNLIKPDRMIKRFLSKPINRSPETISPNEAQNAFERILNNLQNEQIKSIRHLDYIIWNYQRNQ